MHYPHKTYSLYFSLLLLLPFCTYPEQNKTPYTVNISPVSSPINNPITSPTYNTEINPQFITNTTSTINAVGMQVRDIALHIMEKAQQTFTPENYNTAKIAIKELIWNYRYTIATGTILGAYSGTGILLLTDYNYLTDSARWSYWKSDYTFEALCAIPHNALEQELLRAIGERNYNKTNPTDFSHPLITFIATIEAEIKICKRYLAITQYIKQLHLMTILPTNENKIEQISRHLERSLFIKHIFLSWLAERNITTKSLKKNSIRLSLTKFTQNRTLCLKKGSV